jgi:SNF2 family DNA or RNA helicase
MQHQQDGVKFAINNNGIAALHYEVGCGKTLTALGIYEAFKKNEPGLKLLVICPISLIHGAWVKEIEKFTDFKWFDLHRHNPKNSIICDYVWDIHILNFEYLISKPKFIEIRGFLEKNKFMCVIDESSKMKNHSSVTVDRLNGCWEKGKYIQGIKDLCKYRIELTGTPAPNDFHEYWAQMYFLNPSILGNNFYKFRNQYYSMQRGKEIVKGAVYSKEALREMFSKGYKYQFDESKREEFFNRLKPWCHVVKAKDCLDLPESIDEYRMVEMTSEQNRVYKEMKTQFVAEIKAYKAELVGTALADCPKDGYVSVTTENNPFIIANLVLTKMIKLHQITSNFAIDENGVAHTIGPKNPKMDALLEIIEECPDKQIIIWAQFKHEIAYITQALKQLGGVSELHGGIDEKYRIEQIDRFLDGTNRFMVCHPRSAAHGLTFINSSVCIYFSLSYSYEEYIQSRGRIMRHGQKNNCLYFHILAQGTVDEDILAICQKKQDKQDIAERFLKNV